MQVNFFDCVKWIKEGKKIFWLNNFINVLKFKIKEKKCQS
jgi:hypothetical protein